MLRVARSSRARCAPLLFRCTATTSALSPQRQRRPPATPAKQFEVVQRLGERSSSKRQRLVFGGDDGGNDDGDDARQLPPPSVAVHPVEGDAPPSAAERLSALSAHLLPRGYPASVSGAYWPYAQWQFVGAIASTVSSVLSMQALLFAVGLGAGSIPMAAALNWVMKDGIGQLGGVAFASYINSRFDADPKRFRMVAAIAQDASVLVEIAAPLAPGLFLPIASVANVGKNVAWLSASATRAAIHRTMLTRENLADVTAKAGSQTTLASTVGTGIGVLLSPLIGADTVTVMGVFAGLSGLHLWCQYKSLSAVVLPTLNAQRLEIVLDRYLRGGGGGGGGGVGGGGGGGVGGGGGGGGGEVLRPEVVGQQLEQFCSATHLLQGFRSGELPPASITGEEASGAARGGAGVAGQQQQQEQQQPQQLCPIVVGPSLADCELPAAQWAMALETCAELPYVLCVTTRGKHASSGGGSTRPAAAAAAAVLVLLKEDAPDSAVLHAYVHAALVQRAVAREAAPAAAAAEHWAGGEGGGAQLVADALPHAALLVPALTEELRAAGWNVDDLFLEFDQHRVAVNM